MAPTDDYPILLQGKRTTLRDFIMDDIEAVDEYASDPVVSRYLTWGPNTRPQTQQFVAHCIRQAMTRQRQHFEFGIVENATRLVIGGSRITVRSTVHRVGDIGYVLRQDRWGQGYGTETARILIDFGFSTLGLHRIEAICDPENIASRRILEKAGMQYEGHAREHLWVHGKWRDSLRFAVLEAKASDS